MEISDFEIFATMPHFASEPRPSMRMQSETIRFSPAKGFTQFTGKHPQYSQNFDYLLQSEEEILEVEEFFVSKKGKFASFFMPTWMEDIVPAASILENGDELSIEPVGYLANYFAITDPVTVTGNHLLLVHEDGTLHACQVMEVNGTDPEVLTIDPPVPQDFLLGQFTVCFLIWSRFLTDEIEFIFICGNAQVSLATSELIAYEGHEDV